MPGMTEKLNGIAMEIEDCNFPLLEGVIATSTPQTACTDCDVAILLGGFPRLANMERRDLIHKNAEGMRDQAMALDMYAKSTVKVLVVANPANTNCLVAMRSCSRISPQNFSCLTRLDHERLRFFIAKQANYYLSANGSMSQSVSPSDVSNICIWGNHSATQVPYLDCCSVNVGGVPTPAATFFTKTTPSSSDGGGVVGGGGGGDSEGGMSLDELVKKVQTRGAAVLSTQGASSGFSAANAIAKHLADWLGPSPTEEIFSMGIQSTGNSYGVPDGLVFSFPCTRVVGGAPGQIAIVTGLEVSPAVQDLINKTTEELIGEMLEASFVFAADGGRAPK